MLAGALLASVLVGHGFSLASGVAGFARNGQLSHQLRQQIEVASERASQNSDAILVVIPELPDEQRQFWHWSFPYAVRPPFMDRAPAPGLIPSYNGYCCPHDWLRAYGPLLARVTNGESGPIYVLEWDAGQGAFVTRVLDHATFRGAGYAKKVGGSATLE
jgi:hypothetical protein